MTVRLADIRVALEHGYGLGGGVGALLSEVAQRLESLAAGVTQDPIDLRSLPLNPSERERLVALLGAGEVEATLEIDGKSHVRETAIAGLWWIEHRDASGQVIAETLEIARIPEILGADLDDIGRSARKLRERIRAAESVAIPEEQP